MKHATYLTKNIPAKGQTLPEGHPDILGSIKGLVEDPLGVVMQHFTKGGE